MEQPNDYSEYNMILWKQGGSIYHYPMWFLNFESLKEDFEYIMFLKFDSLPENPRLDVPELVGSLNSIFADDPNSFVLLTPGKDPPLYTESPDEFIYSFSCSFHLFKEIIDSCDEVDFYAAQFLFLLLDQLFKGESGFHKIFARQLPIQDSQNLNTGKCDVIIPHKGNNTYLADLLSFLHEIDQIDVYAGIDQKITEEIRRLRKTYNDTSFYEFSPNPVGPYVIRNQLIEESTNQLICFQDSDDIPCADRFRRLSDYMIKNNCQLCGSHEIKMDYYDKTVRAIRYPKNVTNALAKGGGHALLHPSSMMTRAAFYLNGKLSEERTFGNDTKFLYHGYFMLNSIENIDEFLYIRRRHPASLTTAPETCIGSPARNQLFTRWLREFDRVKHGILKLENTGLKHEDSTLKFRMKRF